MPSPLQRKVFTRSRLGMLRQGVSAMGYRIPEGFGIFASAPRRAGGAARMDAHPARTPEELSRFLPRAILDSSEHRSMITRVARAGLLSIGEGPVGRHARPCRGIFRAPAALHLGEGRTGRFDARPGMTRRRRSCRAPRPGARSPLLHGCPGRPDAAAAGLVGPHRNLSLTRF
jgi:hypothetical protein